eukprot:1148992-Pelagomonas_calceolata.AAC.7
MPDKIRLAKVWGLWIFCRSDISAFSATTGHLIHPKHNQQVTLGALDVPLETFTLLLQQLLGFRWRIMCIPAQLSMSIILQRALGAFNSCSFQAVKSASCGILFPICSPLQAGGYFDCHPSGAAHDEAAKASPVLLTEQSTMRLSCQPAWDGTFRIYQCGTNHSGTHCATFATHPA